MTDDNNELIMTAMGLSLIHISVWVCDICGYRHEGTAAPKACPVCGYSGAHFAEEAKNY